MDEKEKEKLRLEGRLKWIRGRIAAIREQEDEDRLTQAHWVKSRILGKISRLERRELEVA